GPAHVIPHGRLVRRHRRWTSNRILARRRDARRPIQKLRIDGPRGLAWRLQLLRVDRRRHVTIGRPKLLVARMLLDRGRVQLRLMVWNAPPSLILQRNSDDVMADGKPIAVA